MSGSTIDPSSLAAVVKHVEIVTRGDASTTPRLKDICGTPRVAKLTRPTMKQLGPEKSCKGSTNRFLDSPWSGGCPQLLGDDDERRLTGK